MWMENACIQSFVKRTPLGIHYSNTIAEIHITFPIKKLPLIIIRIFAADGYGSILK